MLRQYAFIFLLFLLTFSALLGGVSAQNDIQSEIENARQKGYSDEEIRQALKNATWTEAQIDKLLSTPQAKPNRSRVKNTIRRMCSNGTYRRARSDGSVKARPLMLPMLQMDRNLPLLASLVYGFMMRPPSTP